MPKLLYDIATFTQVKYLHMTSITEVEYTASPDISDVVRVVADTPNLIKLLIVVSKMVKKHLSQLLSTLST